MSSFKVKPLYKIKIELLINRIRVYFYSFFKHNYKRLNVYIDVNENIYIEPTGYDYKYGGTFTIEPVVEIKSPYTDQELEKAILLSFKNCYLKKPDNNPKNQSPITYYLGYMSTPLIK